MSTYNGWSNYETWNVNLWLDSGEFFREDILADEKLQDISNLANYIKDYVNMMQDEINVTGMVNGMFVDLLNSAINEVNFYEIAEGILDGMQDEIAELKEEEEEEEEVMEWQWEGN